MYPPGETSDWIFIDYYFHLCYEILLTYISNVKIPQFKEENIMKNKASSYY